jgi:hypothetical protein
VQVQVQALALALVLAPLVEWAVCRSTP